MSDHFDLADFQAPDPAAAAVDITGLYAFQAPDDSARSVLILAVNPYGLAPAFDSAAIYRIDVDIDGDLKSDLAFSVVFSDPADGPQLATLYRVEGADGMRLTATKLAAMGDVIFDSVPVSIGKSTAVSESGGYRLFAGRRSDPFFADAVGLFNGYQFTGVDSFAGQDVLAIALELPSSELGDGAVAVWARTLLMVDGEFVQVDRTGGSNLMNFLTYGSLDEVRPYRESGPDEDRVRFTGRYASILETLGYTADEARATVSGLLPDVLWYDHRNAAGFPNGRRLSDDLADLAVSLMTHGRITDDAVGPHDDLEAAFPYVGRPHRA